MYVKDALDFSIFPSILLITTLLRLALNISSTRLILSNTYAGNVIQAFGSFVIGGTNCRIYYFLDNCNCTIYRHNQRSRESI